MGLRLWQDKGTLPPGLPGLQGKGSKVMNMIQVGDEFGWSTLSGEVHYGKISDIDSNVIYVRCQNHDKQCCTEATRDELAALVCKEKGPER